MLPLSSEHGFIGYSAELLISNTIPNYSPGETFFTVFGVFFPAATGKQAPSKVFFLAAVLLFHMKYVNNFPIFTAAHAMCKTTLCTEYLMYTFVVCALV